MAFTPSLELLTAPPRDGQQPRQGLFREPVATNLLVEANHSLLSGVFGVVPIANPPPAKSKHHRRIPAYEPTKRVTVTRSGGA